MARLPKIQKTPARVKHPKTQSARSSASAHPLLALQKDIGNQAVQRLMRSPYIQRKLQVGKAGDRFEQEADHIADQVSATQLSAAGPSKIQRLPGQSTEQTNTAPASVDQALGISGTPLEPVLRQDMEQRFGHDFSGVRLHTGTAAEQSAQDVNAQAYTVGQNIVFGSGRFAPGTQEGQRLIAHELTHVVQQTGLSESRVNTLQRTPAAPVTGGGNNVPFDRSKVDIDPISDVPLDTDLNLLVGMGKTASVNFIDPSIKKFSLSLYDPADQQLYATPINTIPGSTGSFSLFDKVSQSLTQGRHLLRCIGYDNAGEPIAYSDRSFFIWTTTPTGKPPDIAALETQKTSLEAVTQVGSGKEFGEVAGATAKLLDVTHRLGILTTGTGAFVGSQCPVQPTGAAVLGCTNVVLLVLEKTFTQQGKSADWAKIKKKIEKNTKSRGKKAGLEGWDIQAALQSEAGWKGIFWAPDPSYEIPKAELSGARGDEAGYAAQLAKKKHVYKEKGRPSVSIDYLVTNYAPEAPRAGHGTASTTTKDVTQLDKLKKLPFGVLSAHGAHHMAFIIQGNVLEVHWDKEATDVDLIQVTPLENWAVGRESGYHYFASGAIVAPAADVDAAFK